MLPFGIYDFKKYSLVFILCSAIPFSVHYNVKCDVLAYTTTKKQISFLYILGEVMYIIYPLKVGKRFQTPPPLRDRWSALAGFTGGIREQDSRSVMSVNGSVIGRPMRE